MIFWYFGNNTLIIIILLSTHSYMHIYSLISLITLGFHISVVSMPRESQTGFCWSLAANATIFLQPHDLVPLLSVGCERNKKIQRKLTSLSFLFTFQYSLNSCCWYFSRVLDVISGKYRLYWAYHTIVWVELPILNINISKEEMS